jgi:hypothetical protein
MTTVAPGLGKNLGFGKNLALVGSHKLGVIAGHGAS